MDPTTLLAALKLHARIDTDVEDAGLVLMLAAAAGDVAHAASYSLPAEALDLPADIQFAIVDQAARAYDQRGPDEGKPGLSLAASRIAHRYRGVTLGASEAVTEGEAD